MSYSIGTRVIQQFVDETVQTAESDLPTLIVGPLFQVFEREVGASFDPTSGLDQTFSWPGKPVGSVIDLQGTRNGLIDSQRMPLAPMEMKFYLFDGTSHLELDDEDVESIGQSTFVVKDGAKAGKSRATISDTRIITVDNETFVYSPSGTLGSVQIGDVFVSGTGFTVSTVSPTQITTDEDLSGQAVAFDTYESTEIFGDVSIAKSPTSGRIVVTMSGGPTFDPAVVPNSAIVVGQKMLGLTGVTGAADGAASVNVDGLAFGVTASTDQVVGKVVKVVLTPSLTPTTSWHKVVAIDTVAGTLTLDTPVAGASDDDEIEVTIYQSQVGYVESVSTDKTNLTAVVPTTFADSDTFAYLANVASAITFYPPFQVSASYRAIRKDKSASILEVGTASDIQANLGISSVDYRDGVAFAANVYLSSRVDNEPVFIAVVDPEIDGTTGLPENRDLAGGYAAALELAEGRDVYNVLALDDGQDAAVVAHALAMSNPDEKLERRAYVMDDVPLGRVMSSSGIIEPGRTVDGLAPTGDEGNAVIRGGSGTPINFVTEGSVAAGEKVVVVSPPSLAGTYTVDVGVTDTDLPLVEGIWALDKEVITVGVATVTTSGGFQELTGLANDSLNNAEAGDYVEIELSGTTYRMRVLSVLADGTGATLQDEVAGDLTFAAVAPANLSLIRSWSPTAVPAVEYYVAPLTREQIVVAMEAGTSVSDRRVSVVPKNRVFMQTGVDGSGNPVEQYINPRLSLVTVAAKRSGLHPSDDASNLALGGGILKVERAFDFFRGSQLNRLAAVGYTLIVQEDETSAPYIRDMLTSDASTIERHEEVVTANADWQSKQLRLLFGNAPGQRIAKNIDARLGIRRAQLDSILKDWRDRGYITDFRELRVDRNPDNARKTDVSYTSVIPLGDKEAEITINLTTQET